MSRFFNGEYLRLLRKHCKLTISELSFRTGVSYKTLGHLERNEIRSTEETNKMISDYFLLGIDRYNEIMITTPVADPIKLFVPYLTEYQMITANPKRYYTIGEGLTVGDINLNNK